MNTDNHDDLIDGAIRGELTIEQQQQFEKLLIIDTEFRKIYQFRNQLKAAMQVEQKKKLDTFFANQPLGLYKNPSKFKPIIVFVQKSGWAVAASIVLMLGLVVYLKISLSKKVQMPNQAESPQPSTPKKIMLPVFTYSDENLGVAGTKTSQDSISILVFYDSKKDAEYRFNDILRLYGNFDLSKVKIEFDVKRQQYKLICSNKSQTLIQFAEKNIKIEK
jgi:hypothetical protein